MLSIIKTFILEFSKKLEILFRKLDNNYFSLFIFVIASRFVLLFLSFLVYVEVDRGTYWHSFFMGMLDNFNKADVTWYTEIANSGYLQEKFSSEEYRNWAFYPLWPAVLWLSKFTSFDIFTFGLLVCNLLLLASTFLLYKLLKRNFSEELAFLSCILFLLFPYSYYFSRPGNEAIFLFLTLLALFFGQKKNWFLASVFGALSTLARVQGLFIIFPLLYLYYKEFESNKKLSWGIFSFLLIPASLLGFMYHLYLKTGNFFASFEIQKAWFNTASYPLDAMIRYVKNPTIYAHGWELSILTFGFMLASLLLAVWMILKNKSYKIPVEYLILMSCHLFVNVSRTSMMAGTRYLIVIFPLFIGLACILEKKPRLLLFVYFLFSSMLCFFTLAIFNNKSWAMP